MALSQYFRLFLVAGTLHVLTAILMESECSNSEFCIIAKID
jgi:hypothetical protein